jgi:hypothetical protein
MDDLKVRAHTVEQLEQSLRLEPTAPADEEGATEDVTDEPNERHWLVSARGFMMV